jgi:hypothetical protein
MASPLNYPFLTLISNYPFLTLLSNYPFLTLLSNYPFLTLLSTYFLIPTARSLKALNPQLLYFHHLESESAQQFFFIVFDYLLPSYHGEPSGFFTTFRVSQRSSIFVVVNDYLIR